MYGKIFESLYRGSMVGKGSPMFAVWGYVIPESGVNFDKICQNSLKNALPS
jgi:hypothetical protein